MLIGNKHTQESITWKTPRKPVPNTAIPAAVLAKLAEGGAGAFVAFVEKQQLAASRRSDSPDWIPRVAMKFVRVWEREKIKRGARPTQEALIYTPSLIFGSRFVDS